ncbi:MAG: ATP-binding cassette domain-containing protein [Armatimonadota bacterium]|nr:ATP-binding cassette domain-containing protein [Armatimonadota bacterium]
MSTAGLTRALSVSRGGYRMIRVALGCLAFLVCFYLVVPALVVVPLSFSASGFLVFPVPGWTAHWYSDLLGDPVWRAAIAKSAYVAVSVIVLSVVLGSGAAYAFVRSRGPLLQMVEPLFVMPVIVPVVVYASGMYLLALRLGWTGSVWLIIVAHVALSLPYVVVTLSGALRTTDYRLELAAETLGKSRLSAFARVTLRLISPAAVGAGVLAGLVSLDETVAALFLGSDIAPTLPVRMYSSIRYELDPVLPAAASLMLGLAAALGGVAWGARWVLRRGVEGRAIGGRRRGDRLGRRGGAATAGRAVAEVRVPSTSGGSTRRGPMTGGEDGARGMLEARELVKRFGAVVAVDHVDVEVRPGELVTLLGPSGSGKSTTLALVAGFEDPDGGCVVLDGRDVTSLPPRKRNVGVVFQNYALFPHMTVYENVAFGLRARGLTDADVRQRVMEVLELVRLEGLAERFPRELSGGQQQRVAVARAIAYRPALLLMDEPLSALDRYLREELQSEIRRLHRDFGTSILYVTHDQSEALALSDRVVILRQGRVEQSGTPQDVYERPRSLFVARFLGQAGLLFGQVEAVSSDQRRASLRLSSDVRLEGTPVGAVRPGDRGVLVVRPEHVVVMDPGGAGHPGPHGLEMRVEECIYQGDYVRVRGLFQTGGRGVIHLPSGEAEVAVQGGYLRVGWRPDRAVIVPAPDGDLGGFETAIPLEAKGR